MNFKQILQENRRIDDIGRKERCRYHQVLSCSVVYDNKRKRLRNIYTRNFLERKNKKCEDTRAIPKLSSFMLSQHGRRRMYENVRIII